MPGIDYLLKHADFSKETDLKQRLYNRLFCENVVSFKPGIVELSDEMMEYVSAAGTTDEAKLPKSLADLLNPELH